MCLGLICSGVIGACGNLSSRLQIDGTFKLCLTAHRGPIALRRRWSRLWYVCEMRNITATSCRVPWWMMCPEIGVKQVGLEGPDPVEKSAALQRECARWCACCQSRAKTKCGNMNGRNLMSPSVSSGLFLLIFSPSQGVRWVGRQMLCLAPAATGQINSLPHSSCELHWAPQASVYGWSAFLLCLSSGPKHFLWLCQYGLSVSLC